MPEKPGQNEIQFHHSESEVAEYSFETGVAEALKRIQSLYNISNRSIAVGINGSGINVGKTALAARLESGLKELGLPACTISNASWESLARAEDGFRVDRDNYQKSFGVYIVDGLLGYSDIPLDRFREYHTRSRTTFPCDLYIAIYRPDKPFHGQPVGDMIIRNTEARDKT